MKISIIGSGNVAWHLGKALKQAGHEIVAVYSPTVPNREELARVLAPATAIASLDMRATGAELVVIAVPDAAIASVVAAVQVPAGAIVVHTSGSQPLAVLQGIPGARPGVFYPLQTFSKSKAVDFRAIPMLLEAEDEQTLSGLQQVAKSISDEVYVVDSRKRKQLHLAAVFACNFTNHLLGISYELLQQAALPHTLLHPLIQETIAKALQNHPFQVQTGPAVRHDQNVIEEHLNLLQDQPDYQQVYHLLTHSIQDHSPKK
ncbi:Rossmann-like and DUF2520 domain-containing protein [Pontibacter ramchanderi]|uniref:Putative short-subunit dehydrogenase-like oxidoreductase (DUF2520 family) n=1 Tax=Pontibacter ramchanderi TaxID=1179743 RepID=A0A2N3UBV8_9BACT|nr:Rossmann-like and DUF2520 domain-containing protein [Pontibacter ramchanderi]PKV66859.1 putative short-subunit dehydrogenase-like oxidoreductase (DUF2520 family) [Pontibacter ramchanderi]